MAVCLDYQAVYSRRNHVTTSLRYQIAGVLLLLAALLFKVWVKVESTDLGYQVAREQQRTVSLDMERRELELQLQVLLRADTLGEMAQQRLGLLPLNPKQARRVRY